jgi:aspartate/glutamate racemase
MDRPTTTVLGIMMLEGRMADVAGCMAAMSTFPYPVIRHVVAGSRTPRTQADAEEMLPLYLRAAQELEADGASVITANCGLIALLHQQLSDAVRVPVVTSSLALVPLVHQVTGRRPVGVLTFFTDAVDERNFLASGWSSEEIPVVVGGVGESESWLRFQQTKVIDGPQRRQMRDDLLATVNGMLDREPALGGIVCECTMLPAVLDDIRPDVPVPIFDILTAIDWAVSGFGRPGAAARLRTAS